ncbi:hypothetical protein ABPG77_001717 [Micractinium sp. CCAP 211/92]
MASAAIAAPTLDWQHLSQQLGKKATFEAAAKQACRELAARPGDALSSDAQQLLSRCRTLLRSRYSSRPFWDVGRALFAAAQAAAAASGDGALAAQLGSFVAECNAFLGEEAEEGSSSGAPPGGAAPSSRDHGSAFLFEGQLSGRDQPPPRPAGLFDLLSGALGQQLAAAAATAATQQQLQQEGQVSGAGEQQQERQGSAGGMQAQEGSAPADQQQGLAAPSPEALEALERELDAIAVAIMEQTGQEAAAQRAAPPASKKVVASLPVEKLTADRLAALGGAGAARCPVCMEELAEGDEVQVMPCSSGHVFHPPCLRPWLEEHNSCPTCRHELPTDDWRYEHRKERERQEDEERRGAANAVSHNEFLYI